jgi:hypothetical protein
VSQAVTPTLDDIAVKIMAFLVSIVPTGTPVLRGPMNRVPLPKEPCVIFTYLFQLRLRTNIHYDQNLNPLAGNTGTEQGTRVQVQMDFYGPQSTEWALAAEMLWRDEYACNILSPEAVPLYTDDARMVPLVTGEDQYWERYTVTAMLQWNPVTVVSQQFADTLDVVLIDVDAAYPP